MFQKIAKHRANDASNDVHRPPLGGVLGGGMTVVFAKSKNVALIVKDWEID